MRHTGLNTKRLRPPRPRNPYKRHPVTDSHRNPTACQVWRRRRRFGIQKTRYITLRGQLGFLRESALLRLEDRILILSTSYRINESQGRESSSAGWKAYQTFSRCLWPPLLAKERP